ncbi:MAG TPA: SCP2 sterol-binding domain-containing protein [Thermoleophilaceae bacterium]
MGLFADEQDVYRHVGSLLEEALADDAMAHRFQRANTVLQYVCRHPESTITLSLRTGEAPRVDLGDTQLRPEVVMTMDSDTLHRFFLGKLNPTVALAKGEIKARGPVAKVLRLVPAVRPLFALYRARLESAGRGDLLRI